MIFCVLDASVALAWLFEDEDSPYAQKVMDTLGLRRAVVPVIWPLEVLNAIFVAIRRGRVEEADTARFLGVLDRLSIEVEDQVAVGAMRQRILDLGLSYQLSAYDACYVELALRRGLPLATQDQRLARAATAAGVAILQR